MQNLWCVRRDPPLKGIHAAVKVEKQKKRKQNVDSHSTVFHSSHSENMLHWKASHHQQGIIAS